MNTRALRWVPGSSLVVAPTAMMQASNVTSVWLPSAAATLMAFGPVNVPHPSSSVILFFRIRKWTPLTMRSDTVRLRLNAVS